MTAPLSHFALLEPQERRGRPERCCACAAAGTHRHKLYGHLYCARHAATLERQYFRFLGRKAGGI